MAEAQIVLYTSYLHTIGGIETFVYSFLDMMAGYDIAVYCPTMPMDVERRLKKKSTVLRGGYADCKTLVMARMGDPIPGTIKYEHSIRMCHAVKAKPDWSIRQDCDEIVNVSEASKASFGDMAKDAHVIHNPFIKTDKKALLLVSATRIPAKDKGLNTDRMLTLAKMLEASDIPFLWFNFSDQPLPNAPKGLINVGTFAEVQPYIARADYLVQLSDNEGFCYSLVEALANGTAVICTPFATTKELGVVDGVNGYVVPFDMKFDVHRLLDVPVFEYTYDNKDIMKAWKKLFGKMKKKPKQVVVPEEAVTIRVIRRYLDLDLDRRLNPGEVLQMPRSRAEYVASKGFIEVLNGVR